MPGQSRQLPWLLDPDHIAVEKINVKYDALTLQMIQDHAQEKMHKLQEERNVDKTKYKAHGIARKIDIVSTTA